MMSTITIKDVAAIVGVSPSTVSRVLSNNSMIAPETRKKVLEAIKDLDYRPNALARGLRSRNTNTIGLMIPDITNSFFAELSKGITTVAREKDYTVLLCTTENNMDL